MPTSPLETWHEAITKGDLARLNDILHEEVVFHSPVVWRPMEGKAITSMYLHAAYQVLIPGGFRYLKEVLSGHHAILEFSTEVEGITINGVDILSWNEQGLLTEVKVMVRPRRAMEKLQELMVRMLEMQ